MPEIIDEMPLKTRLFYLLIGWIPTGIIYFATGAVKGNLWIVPETQVDSFIPFSPYGIWMYLMFYVYIPYTYITAEASNVKRLSVVFSITAVISGILFVFLPSTMVYPNFEVDGVSAYVLNFITENDTPQNCFPSMHGSLITLCTLANWDRHDKIRSVGCILFTVMMYYSIIMVRRHLFIDLSAGILLAVLVWQISSLFLKWKKPVARA